ELQQQVGRRMRVIRKEKGLSQEALAEELGLHRTYVGALERGERNPSLKVVSRLAVSLGVSTDYLLCSKEQH
ncbi:helix-turn-helix transcriptional regulator, partial [Nocardioides dubius]